MMLIGIDPHKSTHTALPRRVRPSGEAERVRTAVPGDLLAEIRSLDTLLKSNVRGIAQLVTAAGNTLPGILGVGPIMAGRLIC